jgi:SAM-dependent methyltransferase
VSTPSVSAAALEVLRCPRCGGTLVLDAGDALGCGCGAAYPVVGGVPRFVEAGGGESREARRTRRAFELEWRFFGADTRLYGGTAAESTALLFSEIDRPEVSPPWVRGKRVLDAGCGHGRYVAGLAGLGAEAFGIDLGLGIEIAKRRRREGNHIVFVQADLFAPPFAPGSFDLVFSKGVVHHTPDPRGAVRRLAPLVRPGGVFFVWVYPRHAPWFRITQEALRHLTKRLPPSLLLPFCFAAAPLLRPVVRRGVNVPTHSGAPERSFERTTWRERAQMIYDWCSPWYQSYHDPEEVRGWLEESGFSEVRLCPIPAGASGRKTDCPSS